MRFRITPSHLKNALYTRLFLNPLRFSHARNLISMRYPQPVHYGQSSLKAPKLASQTYLVRWQEDFLQYRCVGEFQVFGGGQQDHPVGHDELT